MIIYIDGDSSNVIDESIKIGKKYNIEIVIVKNSAHNINSSYPKIITVDISQDSADFYIFNEIKAGDILISSDIGLISMVLAKGAYAITNAGEEITNEKIDFILHNRHINKELRRQGIYPKSSKSVNNKSYFKNNLENLLLRLITP